MNGSPIDSYDVADVYFTFGGGSVGMWIFLVLAVVLFVSVGVRAAQFESRRFAEVTAADPSGT
jgi:hypothetical protein